LPGRNWGCELALICIGSPVRGHGLQQTYGSVRGLRLDQIRSGLQARLIQDLGRAFQCHGGKDRRRPFLRLGIQKFDNIGNMHLRHLASQHSRINGPGRFGYLVHAHLN